MKNKLLVTIFIMLALIFLLPQPSLGIELGTCKDCHGNIKPIPSNILTKDCATCHSDHSASSSPVPKTRDPEKVHDIHGNIRKQSDRKDCQECHRDYPVECVRCHNSHENKGLIKTKTSIVNMSNASSCVDCHGELPQPGGHDSFRSSLSSSKHQWMKCGTCHINIYGDADGANRKINDYNITYEFMLHFGDLSIIPIGDSINLCRICHSSQYKGLADNTHGGENKTCVDCHNPHTTKFGPMAKIVPKEPPSNVSTKIESTTDWITANIPIAKNTTALYVILLIILATVGEYILSKDEEGKKTAYNTIKIHDNEDTLKTLEIKSKSQNISIINEILDANGVIILGMTMTKQEEYGDIDIYTYVIFGNVTKPIDENILISEIAAADDVKSAKFTDKYEL